MPKFSSFSSKTKGFTFTSKMRGFTFIELLVVIGIITILATLGFSTYTGAQKRARDAERKSDLRNIQTSLRLYYNDHGFYPTSTGIGDARINGCGNAPNCNSNCNWGSAWTCGATTYMGNLPEDPTGDDDYQYIRIDEDNYTLQACLERDDDPQGKVDSDATWCSTNTMFELKP